MHGLTRVRQFTISEGHLVIRPDQAVEELRGCLDLAHYVLSTLGLAEDVTFRLSKWDPNNKPMVRRHSTDQRSTFRPRTYMGRRTR